MEKENNVDENEIKLVEYQAAQSSAQHHANMSWTATNILWASSFILLGFVLNDIDKAEKSTLIIIISVLGIILSSYIFFIDRQLNHVMVQKYKVCKTIESQLGMSQHSQLESGARPITYFYRAMPVVFVLV